MKKIKRIRLFKSHKILLQEKDRRIAEAIQLAEARRAEFQMTVNIIAEELGISKKEVMKWVLSEDGEALEEIPEKKKKKEEE